MYTLLSGLYKYMFQKDEYCILILGLDNAGKTVGACSLTNSLSLPYVLCKSNPYPRLQVSCHQPPEEHSTGRGSCACVYGCEGLKLPKPCGCESLNLPKAYGCGGIFRKDTRKLL